MDPSPYALYQEILRLRELLTRVAQDLEKLAATTSDSDLRALCLARAMRIRQRLHE